MAAKKTMAAAEPVKKTRSAAESEKKKTSAAAAATKSSSTAGPAKKAAARRPKPEITDEMIRERAYVISISDPDGSELDHWLAAERELVASK